MSEQIEVDLKDILAEIDNNLARANWTKERAQKYLIFEYHKTSRLKLTDEELLEFLAFTRQLSPWYCLKLEPLKLEPLPPLIEVKSSQDSIEPLF